MTGNGGSSRPGSPPGWDRTALRKDKRINIRLSSRDLMQLRKRAMREGVPYQTLISSTLHKFVSGRLKEAG